MGDEEEGDAVRSLGETIPIVARFRNDIKSSINFDCRISKCVLSSSTVGHWYGTSVDPDTFAARSGLISADDRFSALYLIIDGPAVVKFDWKLESDEDENFGVLFLNDVIAAIITERIDWREIELQVPDAESVVYIAYYKFSTSSLGRDCLYVDNLQVFPSVYFLVFLTVNDTDHGSLQSDSHQLVAINSDSNEIHVNPVFGYELSYWLINGTDILTSDPLVIRNVQGNTTAEAFFQLKTYSVDIESSVGGFTDPQGSQQVVHGDSLNITATPDHGFVFIQWSDENRNNPRIIDDVQSDLVITAEFEEDSSEYFLILIIVLLIVILVVLGLLKLGLQKPKDKPSGASLQSQELSGVMAFTGEKQEPLNIEEDLNSRSLPIVPGVEQIDRDCLSKQSSDERSGDSQLDDSQSETDCKSEHSSDHYVDDDSEAL
ncbi:hypothetical protein GEMRC1_013951 [Eukaryota sp. GEM-RC1]